MKRHVIRTVSTVLGLLCFLYCGATFTPPLGGKNFGVSITDCAPLQTQWVTEAVEYLGWHITTADQADWEVLCTDLGPFAGTYNLGTRRVLFNPGAVNDSFTAHATVRHEFVHLVLDHGPHPETATLHVCDWAYNESPPPGCFSRVRATLGTALMSQAPGMQWTGMEERIMPGAITEDRITDPDEQLLEFGRRP